jgi:hypothetical protein
VGNDPINLLDSDGNALGNLGSAYADLGETRRAIEFYEQQLVIACEIGNRRGEGNALDNLGSAYYSLGDARRAIEFYEQQLVVTREIGDRRGEGNALGNLGNAYLSLGDARKAIEFYEQVLVIARDAKHGDRRGEGTVLGNLGLAYAALGDARRADVEVTPHTLRHTFAKNLVNSGVSSPSPTSTATRPTTSGPTLRLCVLCATSTTTALSTCASPSARGPSRKPGQRSRCRCDNLVSSQCRHGERRA